MPYIAPEGRPQFDEFLRQIKAIPTKGDLEYCMAVLMDIFMQTHNWKYTDLHDCAYAAQHMCDEFRRLFLDKREDEARATNGDVFTAPNLKK